MPDQTESVTDDSRLIFSLMVVAGGFALVGHEIKTVQATGSSTPPPKEPVGALASGPRIILGTFAAAALLALLSHAGDAGRQFAVGLAVITAVSSTLVFGGPVWSELNRLLGHQGPGGTPTTPTVPTQGTANTAAALVSAAA